MDFPTRHRFHKRILFLKKSTRSFIKCLAHNSKKAKQDKNIFFSFDIEKYGTYSSEKGKEKGKKEINGATISKSCSKGDKILKKH